MMKFKNAGYRGPDYSMAVIKIVPSGAESDINGRKTHQSPGIDIDISGNGNIVLNREQVMKLNAQLTQWITRTKKHSLVPAVKMIEGESL